MRLAIPTGRGLHGRETAGRGLEDGRTYLLHPGARWKTPEDPVAVVTEPSRLSAKLLLELVECGEPLLQA